jgi:TPR repeat protein
MAQDQYFGNVDQGIDQNRQEAIRGYNRAANLGDRQAMANVAILSFQTSRTEEER